MELKEELEQLEELRDHIIENHFAGGDEFSDYYSECDDDELTQQLEDNLGDEDEIDI